MPAKKFVVPFASTGNKTAVPNTLQPDGTVSYAQGFGPDYELDKTVDPVNAKDVPRAQTNQLYYDLTDAVGEQQLYGVALWGADRAPYPLNARAYHTGKLWQSNVANNNGEPGVSGWDDVSTIAASKEGIRGSYSNLSASAVGTNATVSFTADAICLKNASNEQIVLNNVSESCNLLTSGVGGIDTGVIAGNTWYAIYVIYNPTTMDVAAIASLSFTAPTLPAGYTHYAFIEAVRSNAGATQISPLNMANGICYYNPTAGTPVANDFPIALGTGSATSLTPISLAALVPPSAKSALIGLNCSGPSTGTAQIRMSSAAASGLLALSVATGQPTASRLWLEFPNPQVFTPHYSVAGSGLATILVMGWRF